MAKDHRIFCKPGHALVLPRRHAVTIRDLGDAEYRACFDLVRQLRPILEDRFKPDGFNVGANGAAAAPRRAARRQ